MSNPPTSPPPPPPPASPPPLAPAPMAPSTITDNSPASQIDAAISQVLRTKDLVTDPSKALGSWQAVTNSPALKTNTPLQSDNNAQQPQTPKTDPINSPALPKQNIVTDPSRVLGSKQIVINPVVKKTSTPVDQQPAASQCSKTIYVNGYWNSGTATELEKKFSNGLRPIISETEWGKLKKYLAEQLTGTRPLEPYWSNDFLEASKDYFNETNTLFVDGTGKWDSTGKERYNAGYKWAKENLNTITDGIWKNGRQGCMLNFLSHSMGGAYAAGMIQLLNERNIKVTYSIYLSTADPMDFSVSSKQYNLQLSLQNDVVLLLKNRLFRAMHDSLGGSVTGFMEFFNDYKISGVQRFGIVKTDRNLKSDLYLSHIDTKLDPTVFKMLWDLAHIQMTLAGTMFMGLLHGYSNTYDASGNSYNTQFKELNLFGKEYTWGGSDNFYTGPIK